jgi:hypothetical protein
MQKCFDRTGMRGWWRRVGSNHRQHDYESCALPLSYAARAQSEVSARLVLSPWSCAFWHGACRSPRASACSTGTLSEYMEGAGQAGSWDDQKVVAGVGFEPTTFGL